MASSLAFFGFGSLLGILFSLALLIPLGIYIIYGIGKTIYLWSYVLIYGIDPRTGKPPKPLPKN